MSMVKDDEILFRIVDSEQDETIKGNQRLLILKDRDGRIPLYSEDGAEFTGQYLTEDQALLLASKLIEAVRQNK